MFIGLFSVFLSCVFRVVFCLIFLDLLRNMFPFKMSSLPLYFLLLVVLFPSFLSSLIKTSFFSSLLSPCFFMSNSLCNKKGYLFRLLQKISFSVFSFQSKKLRFLCFLFVGFFQKFSFFSCLVFLCLDK